MDELVDRMIHSKQVPVRALMILTTNMTSKTILQHCLTYSISSAAISNINKYAILPAQDHQSATKLNGEAQAHAVSPWEHLLTSPTKYSGCQGSLDPCGAETFSGHA